jgi:hypothetical protein
MAPLDAGVSTATLRWPISLETAAWGFVAFGIALRLVRYLLCFPLWGDESMLAVNFLNRGYAELVNPLEYNQICPLLFLWIELSAVKLLGFSEYSLRLFPALCGVASVFLFRALARRLLSGSAFLLAVAIFSVSYFPIRHGAEVKPYAVDLAAALMLLLLAVAWHGDGRTRWLWALALAAPVCVGLSLPAVFVAGGVSLALLPAVLKNRAAWPAFGALVLLLITAFAALYFLHLNAVHATYAAAGGLKQWGGAFPPLEDSWRLPIWFLQMHTGRMMAYPIGGPHSASSLTTLLCVVGLILLVHRRQGQFLALCLLPLAVAMAAAFLGKYPYGESARTMQFAAPAICLLAGLGGAAMLGWWREGLSRGMTTAAVSVLLLFGCGQLVRDLCQPHKTPGDQRLREFARWLWKDQAAEAELACAETDLGRNFHFGRFSPAEYRCNQAIYSARHRARKPVAWDLVSPTHPLGVVVHSFEHAGVDEAALRSWLDEVQRAGEMQLVYVRRFRVNAGQSDVHARVYQIYEFVPRRLSARPTGYRQSGTGYGY